MVPTDHPTPPECFRPAECFRHGIAAASTRVSRSSVLSMTSESDFQDADEPVSNADDALIEDELIVEEVSIDGMCGVY
jgi:mycofactocin precursor